LEEKLRDTDCFGIEQVLWPLKIIEVDLPTYVVPIKSYWAMHLFDEELANRSLFGADASLALNVENAYYTGKCLKNFKHPARVLWYVSEDKNHPDTKSIRACSLVTEVNTGKPKDLYRKYQRYGIFEWRDVFELAKKDINREIMGFQFCNTEQFKYPIEWKTIQKILVEEGCNSTFQSITKISHDTFIKLYKLGIGKKD
ncbi:MAG: N-acetyltransferase, partial [Crenarchaeota archaeon]|nr:N-acetyltransferase [Thermoproteota archaeon]